PPPARSRGSSASSPAIWSSQALVEWPCPVHQRPPSVRTVNRSAAPGGPAADRVVDRSAGDGGLAPVDRSAAHGRAMVLGGVYCVAAMVIVGGSVAVSRTIVGFPTLTGQAVRYAIGAVLLLAAVARSRYGAGPGLVARPAPADLVRIVALAATGLVAFN